MKNQSPELGDVVRQFQEQYIAQAGHAIMPSQKKALRDIAQCCTPALGGRQHRCEECKHQFWIYHGCRNRSCPKCYAGRTRRWLALRETEVLPCDYFHVVVTVPEQLRSISLREQKYMYGLLMKTAADVLRELALDPKYLGATPGILSVLHTWTSQMMYHPHVHMLVTAGGIGKDGMSWREPRGKFLVPVRVFSKIVRARIRDAIKKERPEVFAKVDPRVWRCDWCVYCKPYGSGKQAVLTYLARYVHRIAICNSRILAIDDTHVTFRYKDRKCDKWRTMRLSGIESLRRFLMHVLPRGFHKVRYYGLWHHSKRKRLSGVRLLLTLKQPVNLRDVIKLESLGEELAPTLLENEPHQNETTDDTEPDEIEPPCCPRCGSHQTRPLLQTHPPPFR